jgi:hypothetical protein
MSAAPSMDRSFVTGSLERVGELLVIRVTWGAPAAEVKKLCCSLIDASIGGQSSTPAAANAGGPLG